MKPPEVLRLQLRLLFIPQLFLRRGDDAVRVEAELPLEFLERGRGAECLHADDRARFAHVALPTQRRGLLDGDAGFDFAGQNAVSVFARLMIENIPGGH